MTPLEHLISKLAGADSTAPKGAGVDGDSGLLETDPVFVEKLASAVDFIIDSWQTPPEASEKIASAEAIDATALAGRIRDTLQTKVAEKRRQSAEVEEDTAVSKAILGKLMQLKASKNAHIEAPEETSEEVTEEADPQESADFADGEAAEKAASAEDLSLSDVLKAALCSDEQSIESTPDEGVKTAGVLGDGPIARQEATQLLKEKLLAKVRGEEN